MHTCRFLTFFTVGFLSFFAQAYFFAHAWAQTQLSIHGDWTLFAQDSDSGRICYILSWPSAQTPQTSMRKDAYLMISNRPMEGVRDEISVNLQIPPKKGQAPKFWIGKQFYRLINEGGMAWSRNAPMDKKLIEELLKVQQARIESQLEIKGGTAIDTYRLNGFAAARQAMHQACPVPN